MVIIRYRFLRYLDCRDNGLDSIASRYRMAKLYSTASHRCIVSLWLLCGRHCSVQSFHVQRLRRRRQGTSKTNRGSQSRTEDKRSFVINSSISISRFIPTQCFVNFLYLSLCSPTSSNSPRTM